MKAFIKYTLMVVIGVFSSCKKDSNKSIITNPLEGKIKSFEFKNNGRTQNYKIEYDNQGRAVKLWMDSILITELLFENDSIIKAYVDFMPFIGDRPSSIDYIHTVKVSDNMIQSIIFQSEGFDYDILTTNYVDDKLINYNVWGNLRFGVGTSVSPYIAKNILADSFKISFTAVYQNILIYPPYEEEKVSLVDVNFSKDKVSDQILPMQYFAHIGFWEYYNAGDHCTKLLYLLALNGFQIGNPTQKLISNIQIDGSVLKLYEYDFFEPGKVKTIYEKQNLSDSLYSTFTMEYY